MPKKKAQVWVCFREGAEYFFLLLKTNAERGLFWQPVTGGVEPDESVELAALRECREETGLQPKTALRAVAEPFEFTGRYGDFIEYPFLIEVSAQDRQKVKLDPREHVEFQWCTAQKAFEQLKFESNARVLREILKVLSNRSESC
jgi:8-oxo-dGTP pyrophosphatase MutT (NUDIX family)